MPLLADGVQDALAYVSDVKTNFAWVFFLIPFFSCGNVVAEKGGCLAHCTLWGSLGPGQQLKLVAGVRGAWRSSLRRLSRKARILDVSV